MKPNPIFEELFAELERLDLAYPESDSGYYSFKHALLRDVVYEKMIGSTRSTLHARVAAEIERRHKESVIEVAEVLAHHYRCAKVSRKSFEYSCMAGKKSLELYSLEQAESHYRAALQVFEEMSQPDMSKVASAIASLLQITYLRGEILETKHLAERYLKEVEDSGNSSEFVYTLYFYAMVLNHLGEFKTADFLAERALRIAESINEVRARAYARSAHFFCSTVLGRYPVDVANQIGALALKESESSSDNYIVNWAYWSIAWDKLARGLTKDARLWTNKLIDAGIQRRDNRALGMAYWTLSWVDISEHCYEEAGVHADECLRVATTPFDKKAGLVVKSMVLVLAGHAEEGLVGLREFQNKALSDGWVYSARGVDWAIGIALASTGALGEAIRLLETAIKASDDSGNRAVSSWNRIALAEIYLAILFPKSRASVVLTLRNLFTIIKVLSTGKRRCRALLGQAITNEWFDENGTISARINIDYGKLCIGTNLPDEAMKYFADARAAAIIQGAPNLLREIEGVVLS